MSTDITLSGWAINVGLLIVLYFYGYFAVFKPAGWNTRLLSPVEVVGDLVQLVWIATSLFVLPWHRWEKSVWTSASGKPHLRRKEIGTLVGWFLGAACGLPLYGWMKTHEPFQSSLKPWKNLNKGQRTVLGVSLGLISLKLLYWCLKLYYFLPRRVVKTRGPRQYKIVSKGGTNHTWLRRKQQGFVGLSSFVVLIILASLAACHFSRECAYHLRHWWFGFCLLLLSTTTLDNPFDYILQGVMWTLVVESCFNYEIRFDLFF